MKVLPGVAAKYSMPRLRMHIDHVVAAAAGLEHARGSHAGLDIGWRRAGAALALPRRRGGRLRTGGQWRHRRGNSAHGGALQKSTARYAFLFPRRSSLSPQPGQRHHCADQGTEAGSGWTHATAGRRGGDTSAPRSWRYPVPAPWLRRSHRRSVRAHTWRSRAVSSVKPLAKRPSICATDSCARPPSWSRLNGIIGSARQATLTSASISPSVNRPSGMPGHHDPPSWPLDDRDSFHDAGFFEDAAAEFGCRDVRRPHPL